MGFADAALFQGWKPPFFLRFFRLLWIPIEVIAKHTAVIPDELRQPQPGA